MNRRAQN